MTWNESYVSISLIFVGGTASKISLLPVAIPWKIKKGKNDVLIDDVFSLKTGPAISDLDTIIIQVLADVIWSRQRLEIYGPTFLIGLIKKYSEAETQKEAKYLILWW